MSSSTSNSTKINKENRSKNISEDWLIVDKSEEKEVVNVCNEIPEKSFTLKALSRLNPYVPFSIEEISATMNLNSWSNCNVRLIGTLIYLHNDDNYYLESVNEPGGPYRVLLIFKTVDQLPLINANIQIFGVITINNELKPAIEVLFFRNVNYNDLAHYTNAVEQMKRFIPLFINTEPRNINDDTEDYSYNHKYSNDNDIETAGNVYENDDFNYFYNKGCLF